MSSGMRSDGSSDSGKAMYGGGRVPFLRYLYLKGLTSTGLADYVLSTRR